MTPLKAHISSTAKQQAEFRLCAADLSAQELMTEDPITVRKDDRIDTVWQILQHIHHVVVTDEEQAIVGMISHRDLMRWSAAFTGKVLPIQSSVDVILQPFPREMFEETSIRTVAIEMLEKQYGCTPIIDKQGHLKGIITESNFVSFFSTEDWQHPVRSGQTVEFLMDGGVARTSKGVLRVRQQIQEQNLSVADCMTTQVQTANVKDPLEVIENLMRRYEIRHVPITESSGKLVGLLSQRDYLRIAIPELSTDLTRTPTIKNAREPVSHYMRRDIITVTPEKTLAEAANLLVRERIGCLPVMCNGKMVGILSRSDFVRLFANGV